MLADAYRDRSVLVTGHTGFKGAWLCAWLLELGAEVTGIALDPSSEPSLFDALGLSGRVRDLRIDVRDAGALAAAVASAAPRTVFHLAAQSLVRRGYDAPLETFGTNVMGTANLLDALRACLGVETAVAVTTDKCYADSGLARGYREEDRLGGEDPYSASKAGAELVAATWARSFFSGAGPAVVTARGGNVIGGGDWAADRLVPDCARAWAAGRAVHLRHPEAVRPWQHVLDCLGGYLTLEIAARSRPALRGRAFNFGPDLGHQRPVGELVGALADAWGPGADWRADAPDRTRPEAALLYLDSARARRELGWSPRLGWRETVGWTAQWYRRFYTGDDAAAMTAAEIRRWMGG